MISLQHQHSASACRWPQTLFHANKLTWRDIFGWRGRRDCCWPVHKLCIAHQDSLRAKYCLSAFGYELLHHYHSQDPRVGLEPQESSALRLYHPQMTSGISGVPSRCHYTGLSVTSHINFVTLLFRNCSPFLNPSKGRTRRCRITADMLAAEASWPGSRGLRTALTNNRLYSSIEGSGRFVGRADHLI